MELSSITWFLEISSIILHQVSDELLGISYFHYIFFFFLSFFFYLIIKTSKCKCLVKVLYTLSIFMPSSLKTKVKMCWSLLYKINWKEMRACYSKLLLKIKVQQDNIDWLSITSQCTAKIWKLWGNLLCSHSCESIHVFLMSECANHVKCAIFFFLIFKIAHETHYILHVSLEIKRSVLEIIERWSLSLLCFNKRVCSFKLLLWNVPFLSSYLSKSPYLLNLS